MKQSFWLKTLDEKTYFYLKKMNVSDLAIQKWQRMHLMIPIILFFTILVISLFTSPLLIIVGFVLATFIYFQQNLTIKQRYMVFQFDRNLQFSKFARLLVPYLRQTKNGISLYQIFSQMLNRLENDVDKLILRNLMVEMTEDSNDIAPYIKFAEKMSGSDFSVTFMSLLFDMSQGMTDEKIIDELGREVSKQLMIVIDDIILFKQKKFMMFPTKLTMINLILVIGYLVCVIIYQIQQLGGMTSFHL